MKREYPETPIPAVGAVIIHQGKVLLVKRSKEPSRGYWSIPGGVIELGERAREAIKREVKEECGIEIEVGPVLEVVDSIHRDAEGRLRFHYVIVDFLAFPKELGVCPSSDVEEVRWFSPEELEEVPLPPGTEELLQRAISLYSSRGR
ncbi:MAG: NUDIX hydrolase [Anaerolineae bacterium]|nr:NUDIX hydrolase [Anaerolineae bacterium]MDW8102067.1 NUDIX hydrolase [Anaerolineae bacterium]